MKLLVKCLSKKKKKEKKEHSVSSLKQKFGFVGWDKVSFAAIEAPHATHLPTQGEQMSN